jgi:ribosomal protein S3AE
MPQIKKRKKFFDVEIPLINQVTQLQAHEKEELEGRIIIYDLTRVLKGKSSILQLKVKVKGDNITTIPKKIQLLPYFIRRMLRKGTNYVEDSFSLECKDAVVRIKPFLVTRRKVSRAIRTVLRNKAREELTNYVKDRESEKIFDDILKNNIQRYLSSTLKKIYPLSFCDIRIFQVEKEK